MPGRRIRDAVEAGLGVGVLPHYMVARGLAAGRLEDLMPGAEISDAAEKLHLLSAPTAYPPPAQRALVERLRGELTEPAARRV